MDNVISGKELLTKRLDLIKNKALRDFGVWLLDKVPDYFWTIPASSTGKYHPKFSLGVGGVVRHSAAVVDWYIELMRPYNMQPQDEGIFACVFHDCIKQGDGTSGHTVIDHAQQAAEFIYEQVQIYTKETGIFIVSNIIQICDAVASHMGIWGERKPVTVLDKFVHLADYCASRKIHEIF